MFARGHQKQSQKAYQVYRMGQMLPVLTPDELLSSSFLQTVTKKIQELSGMDADAYHIFYQALIDRYVEWTQVIPSTATSPLGSLRSEGLVRAVNAMYLMIQKEGANVSAAEIYGLFSAALLFDIGKLMTQYKMMVSNEKGQFLAEWKPLIASLPQMAKDERYKIRPTWGDANKVVVEVTVLLAEKIMPPAGFEWLQQDDRLFIDWLLALKGGDPSGRKLSQYIGLVRNPDIELLFKLLNEDYEHFLTEEAPETVHGEAFLDYLKEGIEKGDINSADGSIESVWEGLFISEESFKAFATLYNAPIAFAVVMHQFGSLFSRIVLPGTLDTFLKTDGVGFQKRSALGSAFANNAKAKVTSAQGILVRNSNVATIASSEKMPAVNEKVKAQEIKTSQDPGKAPNVAAGQQQSNAPSMNKG